METGSSNSTRTARPVWPSGSTTCCCRSSRASAQERAWVLLGTESLQTLGGSGFLQDYPIEQYVRDAKIDTLYEGTTAIQGLDFFFRKIIRDKAQSLSWISMQIQEFAKDLGAQKGVLDKDRELLGKGVDDVQGIINAMVGSLMQSDPRMGGDLTNLYKVGQNTSRLLLAAGDLIVGWLLLRQARSLRTRSMRGPPRRMSTSTPGRSRRLASLPATSCPRLPPARHRRSHRQLADGRPRSAF